MTSPLTDVQPNSIDNLMSKDPLSLTKENRSAIIEVLRQARKTWEEEEISARSKGTKPKISAGISIKDLDIQL